MTGAIIICSSDSFIKWRPRPITSGYRNANPFDPPASKEYPGLAGRVDAIDKTTGAVEVEGRRVEYDTLTVATGARHGYFGHDSWEHVAPGLKKIDDATNLAIATCWRLRRRRTIDDAEERRRLLNFVITAVVRRGFNLQVR